ncbi:hypothetical protein ACFTUC_29925 [Streptomyces sp. NPDC056944]|uniref:hypothetical protein n=1 Tax=Streptomyces sp. NPDC056944 TaxID=3345972 RepID=UPI00363B7C65
MPLRLAAFGDRPGQSVQAGGDGTSVDPTLSDVPQRPTALTPAAAALAAITLTLVPPAITSGVSAAAQPRAAAAPAGTTDTTTPPDNNGWD